MKPTGINSGCGKNDVFEALRVLGSAYKIVEELKLWNLEMLKKD